MNGCLDVVLGLLLALLEALICGVAALQMALSRADPGGPAPTGPPKTDWTAVLVFGGSPRPSVSSPSC
ncbi:hypothetical protein ACIPDW_28100 [Streptomyces sp. NPDC087290]|uniref:hypothetical protein n=1 Tax=Streptomyces sp. NPDC087290 TaxID=3365776 RepID=UPI00381CE233